MRVDLASVVAAGGWAVFWVQLPVLLLGAAVIILGVTAIRRARPEDVPRVFEAFTTAFGRKHTGDAGSRRHRRHKRSARPGPNTTPKR